MDFVGLLTNNPVAELGGIVNARSVSSTKRTLVKYNKYPGVS